MINSLKGSILSEPNIDRESLTELMNEMGILMSNEDLYKLLIWNDDVNDMLYVVMALSDICKLDNENCFRIMLEAHEKGKSVAKIGSYDEMNFMKISLNSIGIESTVEK